MWPNSNKPHAWQYAVLSLYFSHPFCHSLFKKRKHIHTCTLNISLEENTCNQLTNKQKIQLYAWIEYMNTYYMGY